MTLPWSFLSSIEVFFDFEYLVPIGIQSWRGSYSELALKFSGIDFDGIEKKVMTYSDPMVTSSHPKIDL